MLRDWLSLFKLRIVALLVFVAVVTATVAYGGIPPGQVLLFLAAAGASASAGASVLNQYLDRDIDALMERTRGRPLPSGRIRHPQGVLLLGFFLIALSIPLSLRLNYRVTAYTLAGAFVYVVVYTTWLKRRSAWNVVFGGLAGSCASLAGWFAVTGQLSLVPILLALVLFLWTPPHFWSFAIVHKEDYRRVRVPMLPAVAGERLASLSILAHTSLFCAVSLLLYFVRPFGPVYLLASIVLGGLFGSSNLRLLHSPVQDIAWRNYKLSGVYLLGLFLAMLGDVVL